MADDQNANEHHADEEHHGRHELPDGVPARLPRTRSQLMFGALAVLLCALLGVAIATQVRQTESGDALDTARPADLLVLLDSLQQREASLNTEVADLQKTLSSPEVRQRFAEQGGRAIGGSAETFERFVLAERERWAQVIRAAGLKAE